MGSSLAAYGILSFTQAPPAVCLTALQPFRVQLSVTGEGCLHPSTTSLVSGEADPNEGQG